MTAVEQIGDDFLPFNEKRAAKTPQVSGTFVLADKVREVIYIGMGNNINKSLMNILKGGDACLNKAIFFQIAINPDPKKGVANLFTIYKEQHGGFFPRCNKYDLSLRSR